MIEKTREKQIAIALRKEGKTYSEILQKIHVSKSTLTLWLHSVGMAEHQKQRITQKRIDSRLRAIATIRKNRLDRTRIIADRAVSDIGLISKRELFLIGIVLYWAEGAKQKPWNVSTTFCFCNSDPQMVKLYMK